MVNMRCLGKPSRSRHKRGELDKQTEKQRVQIMSIGSHVYPPVAKIDNPTAQYIYHILA
jgi:hypothetical protein